MPFHGYPGHEGADIRAAKGTPVYAMADGVVTYASLKADRDTSRGQNSVLKIQSENGVESRYLHMDSFTVKPEATVKRGDLIGYSGDRNNVDEHLHIEIRLNKKAINPQDVIPMRRAQ